MYVNVVRSLSRTFHKREAIVGSVLTNRELMQGGYSGDQTPVKRSHARTRPYRPPLMSSYHTSQSSGQGSRVDYYGQVHLSHHAVSRHTQRIPTCPWRSRLVTHTNRQSQGSHTRAVSSSWVRPSRDGLSSVPKRPKVFVDGFYKNSERQKYPVISLVSYNLLAQDLIHKNMFLYRTDIPDLLQWEYRRNRLLSEILEISADAS